MDEETHTFAVETTATIEVLRRAVAVLMSETLRRLAPDDRAEILARFVATAGEIPPGAPLPTPDATRFFEHVAEAVPRHAVRFADEVRGMLED